MSDSGDGAAEIPEMYHMTMLLIISSPILTNHLRSMEILKHFLGGKVRCTVTSLV
jgi:hypothetical protein